MKKIFIATFLIVFGVSLTACADNSEDSNVSLNQTSYVQETTVFHSEDENKMTSIETDVENNDEIDYRMEAINLHSNLSTVHGMALLNGTALEDGVYSSIDNADLPFMQELMEKNKEINLSEDYYYVFQIEDKEIASLELFREDGTFLISYDDAYQSMWDEQ